MIHLPWFDDNLTQWLELIDSEQAPHAILLNGINGLGKFELAKQMAHMALCENLSGSGVCNQCSPCELYKAGNHPDLTIISAEKEVIKVDQVRKLSKDIRLSATKNQYRVVIVENAEQMNKASANALLKTLEEPPEKVIIILTTCEMGNLLATIKSRCLKINCVIPETVLAIDWLVAKVQSSLEKVKTSLLLANGSPFLAKKILEDDSLDAVKTMLSDMKKILTSNESVIEVTKKWYADELTTCLPIIAAYFIKLVKLNNGLLNNDEIKKITTLGGSFNFPDAIDLDNKILNFVKKIHEFSYRFGTALKKELLLEELLIQWKFDFK